MADLPDIVRLRLRELAQDATSLQAPNFAAEDLVYHELQNEQHGPITGVWSIEDSVFSFRLIGQVSAHHTFLGEYGDLLEIADPSNVGLGALMRAKWKITLALPTLSDGTPEGSALHRQVDALQQIEHQSCIASPLKSGTVKGSTFVYRTREVVRASIYSDNIYRHALVLRNEEIAASEWLDSRHIFRDLRDERKATLAVRPLELFTTEGDPIQMASASTALSPGTWVELNCTLRMWDNTNVPSRRRSDRERRASVRSFQIAFDSGQVLSAGRLVERPRTSAPSRPAVKRPFGSLAHAAGSQHPEKRLKAGNGQDKPVTGTDPK
ncbi:hypothetical protein AURDEDRAFT_173807 [Auricularia subglabra TFB-10046 SS5]|nr:hypothetical protein AURDEDRAFT_173807 [Auricularia subglabra TFB-10046 SS5]